MGVDGSSRKVNIWLDKKDIRQGRRHGPSQLRSCGRMSFFLANIYEKAAGGNPHDSFSFSYEGGDSFELFNYLKYMITENCDVSVSILEKENKKS